MEQRLNVFLPNEEKKSPPSSVSSVSARLWFGLFLFFGLVKVYQCAPFSIGIGASALAESHNTETSAVVGANTNDHPTELGVSKSKIDPNPMLIGLDEVHILQKLKERRAELDLVSEEQMKRQQDMKILNEVMQKNIQELTQLKAALDEQAKIMQKEPQEALQKMAKLYEGMKPAQASKILEDMETVVVAKILSLMKKQSASAVLAALSDKKARLVTTQTLQMKSPAKN